MDSGQIEITEVRAFEQVTLERVVRSGQQVVLSLG